MADKIYCYPDTDTLINRLNIHDAGRLLEAETRIVSIRLYQLQKHPVKGGFDFAHLCRIHHHIFQDLYGWAGGEMRTVNIAKKKPVLPDSAYDRICTDYISGVLQ
jgi:cell filamentation protein